ncbi:MAG: exo-alpha-sialidase [Lentisphaeria bacterium]|nr:exo-alpha-sialidase [Lentisphaeria bacterium]
MKSESLTPAVIIPAAEKHLNSQRSFQGIPGIAVSDGGRLFAVWYSGGPTECRENFVIISISDDNGSTWSDAVWVVDHPNETIRAFDANIWAAPDGKIRLFWTQCYSAVSADGKSHSIFDGKSGVWISEPGNPDAPVKQWQWTQPRRIADGIMMNKPTVLTDGTWALPVSVWNLPGVKRGMDGAKMYLSTDQGKTFFEQGKAKIPRRDATFDEHSIVELADGTLKMVIRRNRFGNLESSSVDGGRTWSKTKLSAIHGPCSRLWISRLKSGRLILVNNDCLPLRRSGLKRERMTAWLSDDDGKNWYGGLLLDGRENVSYPDGQQAADGSIWVIHDWGRYIGGEIIASHITEEDIAAGKLVSPQSKLNIPVSRTRPVENQ